MTGGLLDFFTLEASEYVEQLDGLVAHATANAPDPAVFGRTARALRGSATMAKVGGIADLAAGLERLAKQVKEGELAWDVRVRGVAIAAIDDAKILIRAVRTWGAPEDQRARARVTELAEVAPIRQAAAQESKGGAYLAAAAAAAAGGLLTYAENPGALGSFEDVMNKVRALRGVAALKDLPPLSEVVDAVDAAAKPIELGQDAATAERRLLFRTAARVLLEGGEAVRNGGVPPTDSVAVREFARASATLSGDGGDGDEVVPIASLLMEGASAVQPAANPPTTSAQRFRLEVVSQAEHLRRLVSDGRHAADAATRERLSRELRSAVRALARAAQSFGALEISNLFIAAERAAAALQPVALDVLDRAAMLLSASDAAPATMAPQFVSLSAALASPTPGASATPVEPVPIASLGFDAPTAAPTAPARVAPRPAATPTGTAPSGRALHDLLGGALAGMSDLGSTHLAAPLVGPEDDVLPIEDLTYRGKEALQRAIELGEMLRAGRATPDAMSLAELYDLLQLAAAE
jgi:chemotaxis protein histidine kinase CheA